MASTTRPEAATDSDADVVPAGALVDTPAELPPPAWTSILLRTKDQVKSDAVTILAGGVAFFAVIAIFPAMVAMLSIYGLVSDPADVSRQIDELSAGLPDDVRPLAPLVLALARLAAQRDAAVIAAHRSGVQA